jgi:nitrate/nitrite transporter NarK
MNKDTQRSYEGNKNRVTNVALVMLCLSFQGMAFAGVALVLPVMLRDLDLSFTQGGTFSAAAIFVYASMQIPAGYLADRYGLKKIFFIGALGTTILFFTFGLISEYWHALLNQSISGFFRAFLFASGIALLANWFGPKRRATAMGLSLVGIFSGHLCINTIGPFLVEFFNWRLPFIAFASAGILTSFVYLRFGKEPALDKPGQRVGMADVFRLFRYRFLWVCGVIHFVRLGVSNGISFWLPSLLLDDKGLSLQVTGLLVALRSLLIAPSNLFGGYVSDRLNKPTFVIGASLVVLFISTILLVRVDHFLLLVALIVINAIFVQSYFGPLFAVPVEKYGIHMMGTVTGFANFFANLGGLTFTYLLGVLKDRTGYFEAGFYAIAATCALGLVFTMFLEQMRRNPKMAEN